MSKTNNKKSPGGEENGKPTSKKAPTAKAAAKPAKTSTARKATGKKASAATKSAATSKKKTVGSTAPVKRKTTKPKLRNEDIALRAYYIAEKRRAAGLPGSEHGDWLEAERQLRMEAVAK